ncbi:MAG: DeoR/GlpR family DNA-binding transcription regulator [Armatimonadota bacterium]
MDLLFVPERWDKIVELLNKKGRATVEELSALLNVSTGTIRRDLRQMQRRGMIVRARGGALPSQKVSFEPSYDQNTQIHVSEKERIGKLTASLIEDGDTVMIDGGSTAFHVARNLSGSGITVVTNSLQVIQALLPRPEIEVVVIGGTLRRHTGTTVGALPERELAGLSADKVILGASAISSVRGVSTPNDLAAEIKKLMIRQSREVIAVADHSKFDTIALYHVAPIESIDRIVTDRDVDRELIRPYVEAGIEVLIAE